MSFKEYLQEKISKNTKVWNWIKKWSLPLTPKFFDEVFQYPEQYCFRALDVDHIDSLYDRQGVKNQVSTFTEFKDNNIFWGPGNKNWKDWYPNQETIVTILKGKVTIKGTSDLWSFFEDNGRRWIWVDRIKRYETELTKTLEKIQKRIKENYIKEIENVDLKVLEYHFTKLGNIAYGKTDQEESKERNKDFNTLIKLYFDISYEAFTYYKDELIYSTRTHISKRSKYNEHLCYSYEVQRTFLITNDPKDTREKYPGLFNYNIEIKTEKQVEAELKKYQKVVL